MVLDQRAVDLLCPVQLADLEQRKSEQVARPLVARLVPQRLLQRDPRIGRISLREGLGARGERAIEFLVLGEIGVVLVEDGARRAVARIDHFAASATTLLRVSARSCW